MSVNQAESYGVQIYQTHRDVRHWECIEVRHLTPSENRGNHVVYVDAVDELGQRISADHAFIVYHRCDGCATESKRFDKPETPLERGDGVVDIYINDMIDLAITDLDGLPSDEVYGIHTRHHDEPGPNGENWNSVGHHSFYVKFQRTSGGSKPTKPVDPIEPPSDLAQQVAQNTADIADIVKWIESFRRTNEGEL